MKTKHCSEYRYQPPGEAIPGARAKSHGFPFRSVFLPAVVALLAVVARAEPPLRPPSVPLVACDPYFSIWSPADKLTDADTVHWTGRPHRLTSRVNIDGKPFRILGREPSETPALSQTGVEVLPTRTVCVFQGEGVQLTLTFMTAALPEDLMIYSRPLTYVSFESRRVDGKEHQVSFEFGASGEICRNDPGQALNPSATGGEPDSWLNTVRIGTEAQPVLGKKGDDLRIDWGWLYLAAHSYEASASYPVEVLGPAPSAGGPPVPLYTAKLQFAPFKVSDEPVSRVLMLAYDDEFSIQYFGKNLRPYWRRNGDDGPGLLKKAIADYPSLRKRCEAFDTALMTALAKAGGEHYARICALAYRQCRAANKVVSDADGRPLMFPKENFSNGCIGTVDVLYPMAPQFLLLSPPLARAMLAPIMDYAASPRWRWPFAPHDLGIYPLANGQVYGGGESSEKDQMPVEETGNMLILVAALAQAEGNPDFRTNYWPVLDKWAGYLKARGLDPEHQLCTDDFAGHLAHNANLSAKAICGLGAYARLCKLRGQKAQAEELMGVARGFAARWVKEADDDGHSRLAFDKPGTWSQKYNLVWDRILGLKLFPAGMLREETGFYQTRQNRYGLPLDSRKDYTKLDWTLWTATLAKDRAGFEALVDPVYRFLNDSPNRVPMTDWYDTKTARQTGFQARSVVGGVFLRMLYEPAVWRQWANRGAGQARN